VKFDETGQKRSGPYLISFRARIQIVWPEDHATGSWNVPHEGMEVDAQTYRSSCRACPGHLVRDVRAC